MTEPVFTPIEVDADEQYLSARRQAVELDSDDRISQDFERYQQEQEQEGHEVDLTTSGLKFNNMDMPTGWFDTPQTPPNRPGLMEQVSEGIADIRRPFTESPARRAVVGGVVDAVQGGFELLNEVGQALAKRNEKETVSYHGGRTIKPHTDYVPLDFVSVPEGDSMAEHLLRDVVQFVSGFGVAGKVIKGMGVQSGLGTAVGAGAVADATFDPVEGNLSTFLREIDIDNSFTQFLDSRVGEDAGAEERLVGRLKNMFEGALSGGAIDLTVGFARWAKNNPATIGRAVKDMVDRGWSASTGGFVKEVPMMSRMVDEVDPGHQMNIERGERVTDTKTRLSAGEKELVRSVAQAAGRTQKSIIDEVRGAKSLHPTSDGWAKLEFSGVDDDGNVVYKTIPYNFHWDKKTGRDTPKTRSRRVKAVATKLSKEVREVFDRADAGDENAKVIKRQMGWYKNMRTRLRDEFGSAGDLFADFLGSTSPNTSVPQNWDMSVQAIRKFVRGDYDKELKSFRDHLDAGGSVDGYKGPLVKKENEKLFGMNSKRLMTSMVDLWRKVEKDTAPKARNFSGNLIGFSNRATIDVWAARTLRRLAGLKRIPPRAEKGVSGKHLTDPSKVGGEFGFGQDVFAEAARQLNETLPKADRLGDDDLQAIIWFKEKEHWAKNNWSPTEGGSFEEQADKSQFSRYQGGATIDRGQGPSDEEMASAASEVVRVLKDDPKVVSYNTSPTIGQYVGDTERAFDIEMTVQKDFEPTGLARELATLAKKSNQDDIFISKVVKDGEDNPNARPGIEIYFQSKKDYEEILPIIEQMNAREVDGFTFGVDMRETEGKYRSLRVQYVPEFSMRYDKEFLSKIKENPDIIDEIVEEKQFELDDLAREIQQLEGVSLSKVYHYDTVVIGRENYDAYTGKSRETPSEGGREAWFGRPRSQNVSRAVARLEGGTK